MGADALKTFVEYFGAGTEQLDFWVENGRVTFTSYTEKVVSGRGSLSTDFVPKSVFADGPRCVKATAADLHRR